MPSPDELIRLMEYVYALDRTIRIAARQNRTWQDLTLTGREIQAMRVLFREEGITQTDLCARSGYTKATASAIMDRLEEKGLARRTRTGNERALCLTEPGRQASRAKYEQDLQWANRLAERLPVELEELETTERVIRLLIECLRDEFPAWKEGNSHGL